MASTAWKTHPPLYWEVQSYLRKPLLLYDSLHSGIANFYICQGLMSCELGDDFQSRLSMSQLHSWRILDDWWVNEIMVRARQHGDVLSVECIESSMMDANSDSREHSTMVALWQQEFLGRGFHEAVYGKPFDVFQLQGARWFGSFTYARQRLAKSEIQMICSQPLIGPRPLTTFPTVLGATPDPCPWLDLRRNGLHTPHYLWDVKQRCTVVTSKLGRHMTYLAISHTWGRWKIGGKTRKINGVPWAVPRNSRFEVRNLPYLLTGLPFSVAYIWIDLLCIPQDNSRPEFEAIKRQEISQQASVFSGAAYAVAWLNDVTDWRGLRQALEWLSIRYFKLFNSGLSMTDHIHNMGVTEEVLEKLLNSTTPRVDTSIGLCDMIPDLPQGLSGLENTSSWFSSLWTLQEAFLRPDMLLCNSKFDVLTASEGFYVTFDMIKALIDAFDGPGDSHVGHTSDHPLNKAFRSSRELSSFFSSLWPGAPPTVLALRNFCDCTQPWSGIRRSPEMILSLASSRGCTGRRAEAIMSVLGTTDWYQSEGAAGTPTTHDLVLGMYPFAFVLEVRNKLGGMFFLSGTLNWAQRDLIWPDTGDLPDWNSPLKAKRGITLGTMLPFNPVINSPSDSFGKLQQLHGWWEAASDKEVAEIDKPQYDAMVLCTYALGYIDHPAVKNWRLCPNSNVLIQLAAIEFSSFGPEKEQSNTGESASHEDRVNSNPGPETAGSSSKAVGKVQSDRDRLEVIPGYSFCALNFAGRPTSPLRRPICTGGLPSPSHKESSLERIIFPGVKHAVCVGETSDNDYLYRAGVILGGQYTKRSKYYVRIGYYQGMIQGMIPLQAKQARRLPSQKVDWIVL